MNTGHGQSQRHGAESDYQFPGHYLRPAAFSEVSDVSAPIGLSAQNRVRK